MGAPDLRPMKAVSGVVPVDDGWAFEIKWDGMRVVADLGGPTPRAVSTNGRDVLARFPELLALAADLGTRVVLDGEVVVFDDAGRSDFGRLQPRMQAASFASAGAAAATPVTFVVFDLLAVGDLATTSLPYTERRRLLGELVEDGPSWLVPPHHVGGGVDRYRAAAAQGLEGLVAKRLDSPYRPGERSAAWRKCKVRNRQEVVVGGWTTGTGGRSATLGALVVGVHDPAAPGRPLRPVGKVGSGFTDATLRDLRARLAGRERAGCPFDPHPPAAIARAATWVDPTLVVEVEFAHWTDTGQLRHAVYLGQRDDRDPATVVREPPSGLG